MHRKHLATVIKTVIALFLMGWLIMHTDWRSVGVVLSDIRWDFLFLAVVFYVCGIAISSYKWRLLMASDMVKSLWWTIRVYIGGTAVNQFLPSVIGGDAFRALALSRATTIPFGEALRTVIIDRLTGLVALVVFAALSVGAFLTDARWSEVSMYQWYGVVVSACLLILPALPWTQRLLIALVARIAPRLQRIVITFLEYMTAGRWLYGVSGGAIFALIGVGLFNYTLFLSIGVQLPFFASVCALSIISILSAVPISINAFGVKEWGYVVLFGALGVAQPVAIAVVLLNRTIQLIGSIAGVPSVLTLLRRRGSENARSGQKESVVH